MVANITGFKNLPKSIVEGTAELVHGVDDGRIFGIGKYAQASNVDTLMSHLTTLNYPDKNDANYDDDNVYAAGYMLLRYLAKQVSDGSDTRILASSDSSPSGISNALNYSLSPDIYSWAGSTVGVADSAGQMSTTFGNVSDALLSFGSSGTNSVVTDSLTVMMDERKSLFYS
jgi:hypothetical protein